MPSPKVVSYFQDFIVAARTYFPRRTGAWMKASLLALLCAGAALTCSAQTFESLVQFNDTNGREPNGPLVQGLDSNFYGTTISGGANGYGTVFKVTTSGTVTILYSFCSQSKCADGALPEAGLVLGTDGNFYGTTDQGGTSTACTFYDLGCGTVFKVTRAGVLTTLHSFDLDEDGAYPESQLIQGTDGNFYGTTYQGVNPHHGTIFKITPDGSLTMLHQFAGGESDGAGPTSALVQATNGNFYGTTIAGGTKSFGTVYQLTPAGAVTLLYSFCQLAGCTDGESPGPVIQAADGNLYGTAGGGANACEDYGGYGCGEVFKLTLGGILTTLYSFPNPYPWDPNGLIEATDGNFYGTTYYGGDFGCLVKIGCGSVFEITPSGTLTILHTFEQTDGQWPSGGLAQATNGSLYGATSVGGSFKGQCDYEDGCGTVYGLSVGLKPFVETQPTSGTVGTAVNILGTNLTDATGVTFNGTPAVFTVVSHSLITTTVPVGATTGEVRVTGPKGTGVSNVPFMVLP